MPNDNKSNFTRFSIGYVEEDIEIGSSTIKVFVMEKLPNYSGELGEKKEETVNNTAPGESISTVSVKGVAIEAKWLNIGNSNRLTPPDVVKGELVDIYSYTKDDKYYWETLGSEIKNRKNERAVFFFSNKKDNIVKDKSWLNKGYHFTIDTKNKYAKFFTSDNDGEKTWWDVLVDTGKGIFTIRNKNEQSIEINSENKTITTSSENITLNGKKDINITSKSVKIKASTIYLN